MNEPLNPLTAPSRRTIVKGAAWAARGRRPPSR